MKLLVLDIEGTIFRTSVRLPGTSIDSTIWQSIAFHLGPDAVREEVETHNRWRNCEYRSYLDWMKDTILIHKRFGLKAELFNSLIESAEYNDGVAQTLTQIDRNRFEIVLISGGFRELAARVQVDFKISHAFAACEYIFDTAGFLDAFNLLPCDFEGKLNFVRLMLKEYQLSERDWLFVGDGANDAAIAQAAPISVAYAAHPELRAVSTHQIEQFSDLVKILASDGDAS